jgi:hypothetical protein
VLDGEGQLQNVHQLLLGEIVGVKEMARGVHGNTIPPQ